MGNEPSIDITDFRQNDTEIDHLIDEYVQY